MPEFEVVPNSRGVRREFRITFGLREGWSADARIHGVEEAVEIALDWMTARAARGEPFLSGLFTPGHVAYSWTAGGTIGRGREPVAIFSGEAIPLYVGALSDETIEALLNELAIVLARALKQERVYVAFRDRTWTLRRVGSGD